MKLSIELKQLGERLGYQFKDITLLKAALSHRSVGTPNNERLEFLGDAVLGMVIAHGLFQRFPEVHEGQLSRMRSTLVKGERLAQIAQDLKLGEVIVLGPGELRSGGHRRASILADALEALLGAIYLEAGFEKAQEVIEKLYHQKFNDSLIQQEIVDHKSFLQEFCQSKKIALPHYQVLKVTGEIHDQHFLVSCDVAVSSESTKGEGPTRRKAEQAAAAAMIESLKLRAFNENQ